MSNQQRRPGEKRATTREDAETIRSHGLGRLSRRLVGHAVGEEGQDLLADVIAALRQGRERREANADAELDARGPLVLRLVVLSLLRPRRERRERPQ